MRLGDAAWSEEISTKQGKISLYQKRNGNFLDGGDGSGEVMALYQEIGGFVRNACGRVWSLTGGQSRVRQCNKVFLVALVRSPELPVTGVAGKKSRLFSASGQG